MEPVLGGRQVGPGGRQVALVRGGKPVVLRKPVLVAVRKLVLVAVRKLVFLVLRTVYGVS